MPPLIIWNLVTHGAHTVPKIILIRHKNRSLSFTVGADSTVYVWFLCRIGTSICKQKPDIYRCICSSHERLDFYAEFQIVFGIVHSPLDELQYDCKKSKGTRTRFESFSSWKTMFWHNNVLRHGVRGKKLFRSIKWSLRLYDSFFGG